MTNEEQNIAVAEWCGWKRVKVFSWENSKRVPFEYIYFDELSDYGNDLNATHEAERRLTKEEDVNTYENHLQNICGGYRLALSSTASQRREALLRTIGKWKD